MRPWYSPKMYLNALLTIAVFIQYFQKYIYKNCHTLVYKSIRRHLQANNLYYYYQYELYCIYRINLVMPTNLLFLMTEIVYAHIAYQTHKIL